MLYWFKWIIFNFRSSLLFSGLFLYPLPDILFLARLSSKMNFSDHLPVNIMIFYSKSIKLIWNTFCTKHPCVLGIQVCSMERPQDFSSGNNNQIVKIHCRNLKIVSDSTGPNWKQLLFGRRGLNILQIKTFSTQTCIRIIILCNYLCLFIMK